MGLIKCPDCGKMVSTRVTACPNCGCPSEFFGEDNSEATVEVQNVHPVDNEAVSAEQLKQPEVVKTELPLPVTSDDIKFKFGRYIVSYPKSTKNIASLYGKYVKLARDYSAKYVGLYNSAGDMHTVLTSLTDKVISDIMALEDMAAKDLYEFGISITRKDFDSKYVPGFKQEIESLYNQYAAIEQEKDDLAYQRQAEKASRERWQGGGFGMKGAIKGAMNAAVLNAGSDLFHSIGDGFKKSGDKRYINNKFEAIYASEVNRNEFVISAFYCFDAVLEGIKSEMDENNLIDIDIFGDYDDISSTYETAIKYEKSPDKLFEKMVGCFKSTPEELKYYQAIISDLFQQDCELEKFLKFWNLSWIFNILQKDYSDNLIKNIKSSFVTNLCSFGVKLSGVPEVTSEGLLIHGQVLKGSVSVNSEVSIIKNLATPIINASVIKILSGDGEVQKTNLGGSFGFVLNLKNKDSIAKGEMLVDARSFKLPESSLYATYAKESDTIDFDFANKYKNINAAWYTFVKEDRYVSNRDISFASTFDDIINSYGEATPKPFNKENDSLLEVAGSSSDVTKLETAKEYLQYRFGKQYAIRFYFNEKRKLLLVSYLKNIGLSSEKEAPKEAHGFDIQIECTKCGKIIGADKKFCNFCGEPSPLYMKRCPSCGKNIKKEIKFCNFCGHDFSVQPTSEESKEK